MEAKIKWLKTNYKELIVGLLCFTIFFVFEAYQQLFYTRNFTAASDSDITISYILNQHLNRWLIWSFLSIIIVWYVIKRPLKRGEMNAAQLIRYLLVIGAVILLNLITIAGLSVIKNPGDFPYDKFEEGFIFYFFHKTPLYFITIVALIVLIHFFKNRNILELTIKELGQLKFSNEKLYSELRENEIKDESFVLHVKTGTRTKLVAVQEIIWIEADDYCVRIHDKHDQTHTLRSSMKALDNKLERHGFRRVHRKAIINMDFVSEFVQNGKTEVILTNGESVPVAQSRLADLKKALHTI